MEPFENNEFETEQTPCPPPAEDVTPPQPQQEPQPVIPPQPEPSAYHGTGAGRKESPYANSPYVSYQQPQQEYHYQPQTQPPVKPKKVKKPREPMGKKILAGALIVALVAVSCWITAYTVNLSRSKELEQLQVEYRTELDNLKQQIDNLPTSGGALTIPTDGSSMSPSQLYAANVNSVVAISSTVQSSTPFGTSEGTSSGSGFILTEDGYVVTNFHVVEKASAIEVITHDGTEYAAKLVGKDSNNDLAVLKVEATGLAAATLGSSTDLVIGDMVVAIGNPLGELSATQTVGYVSGIDREVSTDSVTTINMIQTDAAINPGNSGGPLFNMRGEVIGITTAKYSGTTGSGATIEGIGFAIPIDDVVPLIDDLIDYGYVTGAYLGVSVGNTDAESAAMFGLPTGAYIYSVEEGSAADRAGIQAKDIVIGLGEYKVSNATDLTRALRNFKAGDVTTVTLIRSGRELTLEITLDEKPQETDVPEEPQVESTMPSGDYNEWFDYFRRYFGE